MDKTISNNLSLGENMTHFVNVVDRFYSTKQLLCC